MNAKAALNVLITVLVTNFVLLAKAQQPSTPTSQNQASVKKLDKSEKTALAEAIKFSPILLDNKQINYQKYAGETPGKFETPKVYGPGSGGGGNICAMGITKITKDIISDALSQSSLTEPQKVALKSAIQNAVFIQTKHVPMVRGERKNAVNFPDRNLIVLDDEACAIIGQGESSGINLLMHEYLGLAGIDDRDFRASTFFTDEVLRTARGRDGKKPLFGEVIRNVTICAAQCQSEILGHEGHDRSRVGSLFYSEAHPENRTNSNYCMSNAKEAYIISDRQSSDALEMCLQALSGRFFGQAVDIDVTTWKITPSRESRR